MKELEFYDMNKNFSHFILESILTKKNASLEVAQKVSFRLPQSAKDKNLDFENILIELNFKFLNLLWNNSTGYIKINNDFYWMEHHDWEAADCNIDYWTNPIRFSVKKSEIKNDELIFTFGIRPNPEIALKISEMKNCHFSIENFDVKKSNIVDFINMKISIK